MRKPIVALCALAALSLGACVTDPTSGASGSYSVDPTVTSSRLTSNFGTVGGAPFRLYTIRFIAADTCDSPALAAYEIAMSSTDQNAIPVGDIALRTADPPTVVPSAIQRAGAATVVSGTLSITHATGTLLEGTIAAEMMLNGAPVTLTSAFSAPTCP